MKVVPIILLFLAGAAVAFFWWLDKGLTGGSSEVSDYALAFVGICFVLILLVAFSRSRGDLAAVSSAFAMLPFLLLVGNIYLTQYQWKNRPEAIERRAMARNIACAVKAAGIRDADKGYVRVRINLTEKFGNRDTSILREIEERMHIKIMPDCKFIRV